MATDIASTASIRAVLGVSEKELRDDVLVNPIYSVRLGEAIDALSPTLYDDYAIAAAVDESSRTRAQQRFIDLTQTYAAYHIAGQCLGSVAMFAPKTIKDSRSELTRSDDPYSALRADVPAALAILARQLAAAYLIINPIAVVITAVARIRVTAAPLAINPVTG